MTAAHQPRGTLTAARVPPAADLPAAETSTTETPVAVADPTAAAAAAADRPAAQSPAARPSATRPSATRPSAAEPPAAQTDGLPAPVRADSERHPTIIRSTPVLEGYSVEDVDAFVTRIYLASLQQPRPSRSLLVAQGIAETVVDHCLLILADRGLITLHGDTGFEVVPPDVSIRSHAVELEARARTLRASAHEFAQIFYRARAQDRPAEGVRELHSLDEVHAVTADLVGSAVATIWSMRDRSPRTEELFRAPPSAHSSRLQSATGAPVTGHAVYDVETLRIEGAGPVLALRAEGGERSRFIAGVPFSAVVVDDVGAVVDVSRFDPTGEGSLLVRNRAALQGLQALVEGLWRRATSLDRVAQSGLDRQDAAILSLLAAGASDATVARQTGLSQRTVERRVRSLMDRLGAGTRLQAGVQAARAGWV